jgi:hypothetical protein
MHDGGLPGAFKRNPCQLLISNIFNIFHVCGRKMPPVMQTIAADVSAHGNYLPPATPRHTGG